MGVPHELDGLVHGKTSAGLVVWNMNFICFHMLGIIIPTDELIFFRGVETTNQYEYMDDLGVAA
jgi:hypothetical protein